MCDNLSAGRADLDLTVRAARLYEMLQGHDLDDFELAIVLDNKEVRGELGLEIAYWKTQISEIESFIDKKK